MLFRVEAAVMQDLPKPKGTSQKSSWNDPKRIKATLEATLDAGPVSDDTYKRHNCRKKKIKILNNLKLKNKIPKPQNLSSTIRIIWS